MMSHQKKGIHPRPCGIINLSNIISYGRGTLPYLIEEEKEHVKEIEKLKEYMQTDEYIANIAREKLGMVKENEIIFSEGK